MSGATPRNTSKSFLFLHWCFAIGPVGLLLLVEGDEKIQASKSYKWTLATLKWKLLLTVGKSDMRHISRNTLGLQYILFEETCYYFLWFGELILWM